MKKELEITLSWGYVRHKNFEIDYFMPLWFCIVKRVKRLQSDCVCLLNLLFLIFWLRWPPSLLDFYIHLSNEITNNYCIR